MHAPIGAVSALRRRLPRLPARSAPDQAQRSTASTCTTTCSRTSAGAAIDAHVRALGGFARRLEQIDPTRCRRSSRSSIGHRSRSNVAARHVRARGRPDRGSATRRSTPTRWRRASPAQALFAYAPDAERARRVAVEAAPGAAAPAGRPRQRQGAARHLRQDRHRDAARRDHLHRARPAAGVRRRSTISPCSATSPTRRPRRRRRSTRTSTISRPRSRAEGQGVVPARAASASSRSCGSTKASRCRPTGCWPSPMRELQRDAGRVPHGRRQSNGGDPDRGLAQGQGASIPQPGTLVATAQEQVERAADVPRSATAIVSMPETRAARRGADAAVLPLDVRQHVDAGPVRDASRAAPYYYLTDVDPSWPPERQEEHLRDFNMPDALDHLDARGVSRALPALPAPAPGRLEAPQVDAASRRRRSSRAGRTTAST